MKIDISTWERLGSRNSFLMSKLQKYDCFMVKTRFYSLTRALLRGKILRCGCRCVAVPEIFLSESTLHIIFEKYNCFLFTFGSI